MGLKSVLIKILIRILNAWSVFTGVLSMATFVVGIRCLQTFALMGEGFFCMAMVRFSSREIATLVTIRCFSPRKVTSYG